MNYKIAKITLDKMISINKEMDELLIVIKDNSDSNDFKHYQKVFGKVMGDILVDVVNPIIKKYPALKPIELD